MTDYSKMGDFEINEAVAISRHPELKDWICFDISGRAVFVINDGKLSRAQHGFSFTSCPSDAWPIIVENKISVMFDRSVECGDSSEWCLASSPCDRYIVDYVSSDKLLRAAMIVYLMMKESENEN